MFIFTRMQHILRMKKKNTRHFPTCIKKKKTNKNISISKLNSHQFKLKISKKKTQRKITKTK